LELKGFAKIGLEPGASGTVSLMLPAAELKFLGIDLTPVYEPGEVEIFAGPCADRAQLLRAAIHLQRD
jgi:beta-glucosidase